jgi:integrase
VTDVADEFFSELEAKVARGERAARTLESYRAQFKNHIEAEIGHRKIQSLTSGDLARLVAQLRTKKKCINGKETGQLLSAWTLNNACKVLKLIFGHAHKRGYVAVNPLGRIADDLPVGQNLTQARVLEAEDVRRLIGATPESYRPLVATLAFTAMRIGEALGLVWDDIDFDAGVVNVRKSSHARPGRGLRAACP